MDSSVHAVHGGAFFDAIGVRFDHLDRAEGIVNADVLDAWYDPAPSVVRAVRDYLPWLMKTSPPTHSEGLRDVIAEVRCVPQDSVLTGNGSSSLMYAALPKLVGPGSRVLVFDPMYGEYSHLFRHVVPCDLQVHDLGLSDFQPDFAVLRSQVSEADLVVVVHPNSPTGSDQTATVETVLDSLRPESKVWIDETYVDFDPAVQSFEGVAAKDPRVTVCKSMSKFYALSGLRVGYLVADPGLVASLEPSNPPWSVGLIAQVAAVAALHEHSGYYADRAKETRVLRTDFARSLSGVPGVDTVHGSVAGFLLIRFHEPVAAQVVARCADQGVFLRNCDSLSPRFQGRYVRIAVKDGGTNEKIVSAFGAALKGAKEKP